jgi:hypothetical protein
VALEPLELTIRPGRTGGWAVLGPYPAPLEAHPLSGCAKEPFHEGGEPQVGRGWHWLFAHC